MNYSLGNTLSRGGALNPDGLSLDLQFATDKSLTARKGPTPTFTRASSATQVGATGLIEFAPENTLLRSEEFDTGSWDQAGARNLTVAANNIASPTGSMTADKLTVGATTTTYNVIQLTPTFISGSTYTVSCYLKANEVTRVSIWATTTATLGVDAYFDLTGSGSVTANAFGTASIQQLSNGWYRCIITGTSTNTAATTLRIGPATIGNSRTYVGNSTDSFYAWGAQLEQFSTARTYIPTTTGVVYGARFDHDPVTRACKGLLIEESRTNVMLRSQDFSNVAWVKSNSTISGTFYTDPSGTSTANELVEDILLAAHSCQQSAGTATIGTTYTFSVFVKRKDTSNQFLLIGATNLVSASFISVNLTNGVTATGIGSPAAPINVSSTAYPNGWYRVQFSVVATSAAAITLDIRLSRDGTWANRSYLGDGVQSSLVWGAQVEAAAFPTSYIPTTTASVVRSQDLCSITGSDFTSFYNRFAGTAIVDVGSALGTGPRFIANEITQRALEIYGTTNIQFYEQNGAQEISIKIGATLPNKVGLAYAINDYQGAFGGVLGGVDTNTGGTLPNPTILWIGILNGNSARLTGHIRSIRYFKKRLPNAKLQTLTT